MFESYSTYSKVLYFVDDIIYDKLQWQIFTIFFLNLNNVDENCDVLKLVKILLQKKITERICFINKINVQSSRSRKDRYLNGKKNNF